MMGAVKAKKSEHCGEIRNTKVISYRTDRVKEKLCSITKHIDLKVTRKMFLENIYNNAQELQNTLLSLINYIFLSVRML